MLYWLLVFASAFLAVLNSMGLVLGPSRCVGYGSRVLVFALSTSGWLLGYVVEGPNFRLPHVPFVWVYAVPLLLVFALTLLGYPTSVTQLYVAALLGYSLAEGYGQGLSAVAWAVFSWALSFAAGFLLSAVLREALVRVVGLTSVGKSLLAIRVCSLVYVFLLSYVLGGNVLGTVASLLGAGSDPRSGLVLFTAVTASAYVSFKSGAPLGLVRILFPMKYLSSIIPYSVSILLTQVANRAGLPIVTSLVMFSSTLGVGMASELAVLHRRRVFAYLATSYAGSFALSLLSSYLLTRVTS